MAIKIEHAGAKGSSRSSGFWGKRADAKQVSKKLRREDGKREGRFSDDASGEMEAEAALHRAMEGRDMSTEELVAALRGY